MDDLVLNNKGLIIMVIKKLNIFPKTEDEFQEYFDYGMEGLIKGAKTYDKSKGIAESTYLTICIKYEIMKCFKLKTTKKRYNPYGEVSLDDDFNGNVNLYEVIPNNVDVEKEVIQKIRYEQVVRLLNKMKNKKYVKVVKMYYGIGCKEKNLTEIAKEMGLNRTRVSMMRKAGMRKLKKLVKEEDI